MLRLVTKALTCLKSFSPALYEIVLEHGVDISQWDSVVGLGFSTPGLDYSSDGVTFGDLLSCVTLCLRHLAKQVHRLVVSFFSTFGFKREKKTIYIYLCEIEEC